MLPELSPRVIELMDKVSKFMDEHVYPNESKIQAEIAEGDRWQPSKILEGTKATAKGQGLWNLFLPESDRGAGLTNYEYAHLCEMMGRTQFGSEAFNCSAPDTGNMETLERYASNEVKEEWLVPLLEGKIRSAFAMTEPLVASSDATNIESQIIRDGDEYEVNGRKWFTSGANDPRCKVYIFMGKSDPKNPDRHKQQSMILVPMETEGIEIIRPLSVFGYIDQPFGHAEINFDNVRVPKENIILGEGRGFEIAQGRLGPGRIHHCMRLIGMAKRALEMMCERAENRIAFGRPLSAQGSVRESIALSASEIEQARLLTLMTADKMDRYGNKKASDLISMIKVVGPRMACNVLDRPIQIHGAGGVSGDYFLAEAYAGARTLRLADGPDEVHLASLAKKILKQKEIIDAGRV